MDFPYLSLGTLKNLRAWKMDVELPSSLWKLTKSVVSVSGLKFESLFFEIKLKNAFSKIQNMASSSDSSSSESDVVVKKVEPKPKVDHKNPNYSKSGGNVKVRFIISILE